MNKFWVIVSHTYMSRLKSKAFIISTIITLAFIVLLANIQSIMEFFMEDDADKEVLVIDNSEEKHFTFLEALNSEENRPSFTLFEGSAVEGKRLVRDETYDALLIIDSDDDGFVKATLYENSASQSMLELQLKESLNELKRTLAIEKSGLDAQTLEEIFAEASFKKIALDETSKTEEELGQARGIVYIMLFVLYMAVIIYGQMIAMDVATEKSSRVMELLISSAPPVSHMFAKIIGIALLGLTQLIVFFIVGASLIRLRARDVSSEFLQVFGFSGSSLAIYLYALLFFILGYLLYATIAAMLGSLVSRVEDVQQLIMPMVLLIMIAFFIAIFGLANPEATFITVTSHIPFFAPMIMFLRVGMLDVPLWEVIISIATLLITIVILGFIGARIYRGGVLMYGPSRTLRDFKQALMLTKKEK